MSKAYPLQTLLDLSQLRMDNAARLLGELLSKEMEANERTVLLAQYRNEYEARFVEAAKKGIGRDALSNYQTFLGRLDQAIAQAQQIVDASKQRTAEGQQAWLAQRSKVKAFDTLSQRHSSRELRIENRQEQKSQDEHGARERDGNSGYED